MQDLSEIKVFIPTQIEFKKYERELEVLYKKNQEKIADTSSFNFVRDKTLFYAFVNDENLVGAIYFFMENGQLFLNAYSKRKKFDLNLKCLKKALTWFNCPVYALAQNRASALCLLRTGFVRVENNLFIYKRA